MLTQREKQYLCESKKLRERAFSEFEQSIRKRGELFSGVFQDVSKLISGQQEPTFYGALKGAQLFLSSFTELLTSAWQYNEADFSTAFRGVQKSVVAIQKVNCSVLYRSALPYRSGREILHNTSYSMEQMIEIAKTVLSIPGFPAQRATAVPFDIDATLDAFPELNDHLKSLVSLSENIIREILTRKIIPESRLRGIIGRRAGKAFGWRYDTPEGVRGLLFLFHDLHIELDVDIYRQLAIIDRVK